MEKVTRWNPITVVANALFWRRLQERGPSLTFARLCTSRHLQDLQFIAVVVMIVGFFALLVAIHNFNLKEFDVHGGLATGLLALCAAALNWIYQVGSRRIGAVDLFACEISVICRVGAVVDYASTSTRRAGEAGTLTVSAGQSDNKFTSQENYTPVNDKMIAELEPLDVNVVTYVTEFYTYRKTMMDYLRSMTVPMTSDDLKDRWNQMIYMQFLMYESGRNAIQELVEFEPNRAESLVNILCSELVLYAYLLEAYRNDSFRGDRLRLRHETYEVMVPTLNREIRDNPHPSWARAKATAPEMMRRFDTLPRPRVAEPQVKLVSAAS